MIVRHLRGPKPAAHWCLGLTGAEHIFRIQFLETETDAATFAVHRIEFDFVVILGTHVLELTGHEFQPQANARPIGRGPFQQMVIQNLVQRDQILFLDPNPLILDSNQQSLPFLFNINRNYTPLGAILNSIVQQGPNYGLKPHFICGPIVNFFSASIRDNI